MSDATKSEIKRNTAICGENKNGKIFVYLFFGDLYAADYNESDLSDFPKERVVEILSSESEKTRRQKTAVWKLLLFAAEKTFGLSADEILFEKTPEGKWLCDKFRFSLSHTDGALAVALAENACGIDIEFSPKFFKKCTYKPFIASFLKRIGESGDLNAEEALKLWTKKESVYKLSGSGVFSPEKTDVKNENVVTEIIGDYVLSVASIDRTVKDNIKIYVLKNI